VPIREGQKRLKRRILGSAAFVALAMSVWVGPMIHREYLAKPDSSVTTLVTDVTRNLVVMDQHQQVFREMLCVDVGVDRVKIRDAGGPGGLSDTWKSVLSDTAFSHVVDPSMNGPLHRNGIDPSVMQSFYDGLNSYQATLREYYEKTGMLRDTTDLRVVEFLKTDLTLTAEQLLLCMESAYLDAQRLLAKVPSRLLVDTRQAMAGFQCLTPTEIMTQSEIESRSKILDARIRANGQKSAELAAAMQSYRDRLEDKLAQQSKAVRIVLADMATSLTHMDAQLGYLEEIRSCIANSDRFRVESKQRADSRGLATTLPMASADYTSVIALIRQHFNSQPLQGGVSPILASAIQDCGWEVSSVREFYDQLTKVNQAVESLFVSLAEWAVAEGDHLAFKQKEVLLNAERVESYAQMAYLSGQRVFFPANASAPELMKEMRASLAMMKHLRPAKLMTLDELQMAEKENISRARDLLKQRQELMGELDRRTKQQTQRLHDAMGDEIKPDDKPERVIRKALRLRDASKIDEALAAFSRFDEMFGKKEVWASNYAKTAKDFTVMFREHPIGGLYLYEASPVGTAPESFKVGDIILKWNGISVRYISELLDAGKSVTTKKVVVEILRRNSSGMLQKMEIEYERGTCEMAPIAI
jgi:hypothetical protein